MLVEARGHTKLLRWLKKEIDTIGNRLGECLGELETDDGPWDFELKNNDPERAVGHTRKELDRVLDDLRSVVDEVQHLMAEDAESHDGDK